MMLHTKSPSQRYFKLLALLPIVAMALAVNAETVTDYVYTEPQKQAPVKKGKANAKIKTGLNSSITVVADNAQDAKTFKVYGVVKDKKSGEPVIGAVVQIVNSNISAVTDLNGEFAINVQKGDALAAVYSGYSCDAVVVKDANTKYTIELKKRNNDKAFDVVEEMPSFPGGTAKLFEYLTTSVKYPEAAKKAGVQGRVVATFVVETDGAISDVNVVKSVSPELDAEAVRVLKGMPNWNPGKQNGKAVRVKYTVPVTFSLAGGSSRSTTTENARIGGDKAIKEVRVVGFGENGEAVSVHHPLVVVDGKIIDYANMKSIDPQTIDHMEILKDKSAIDKYGEKAKNGVIVITTKK